MASANLLAMIANPNTGDPAAYYKGAQAGNALMKYRNEQQAQQFIGAAVNGDKNALSQLAQFNPELAMRLDDRTYERGRDAIADRRAAAAEGRAAASASRADEEFRQKQAADRIERIASIIQNANDPATFEQAKAFLQGQGIETSELTFENRQFYIDQARGLVSKIKGGAGLNVVYGTDAAGNVVPMQATDQGELVRSQVPAGVNVMGPGEKAQETEAGKARGKAEAGLDLAVAAGDRIIQGIDDLLADPGLSRVTGPVQSWLPNVTGDANRAQSRLDQIQGGTFLQAYNDLRGGGQITEKEGEKATAAYNRLAGTGMNDADYRQALADFRREIIALQELAKRKAGASRRLRYNPATGELE